MKSFILTLNMLRQDFTVINISFIFFKACTVMDSSSKEIATLQENYSYNDTLARALIQLLPQKDRPLLSIWLEKLQAVSGDKRALTMRNDYTRLLLLAMQSGKLTEPFDRLPPVKDLPPISDIMPMYLFEEMLTSSDKNLSWIDDLISGTDAGIHGNGPSSKSIPPHKLLELQPQPINGITCYFSVFSNPS